MRTGSVQEEAARLGRLAVRALLREVSAAPKPGLVDRFGTGSHQDMDFMTFADSALALSPVFAELAAEGLARGAAQPSWALGSDAVPEADAAFLAALRKIGIDGEARMFEATGGVNTHKGALFLLGLQVAAAGAVVGAGTVPTADKVRSFGARIVRGVSSRELPAASSNGSRAFREHGSLGVRGEAESGLRSLDSGALRILGRAFSGGRPADADCVEALLSIMLVADDTTVLHRGGPDALRLVRQGAFRILSLGGTRTADGFRELRSFSRELIARRISPGGSADLLAAGIFLANLERDYRRAAESRHPSPSAARRRAAGIPRRAAPLLP